MKINNLTIDGVGGIRNLELSFNDGFNVICGANGIGKTTILNTVADAFSNSGELLKRNSMVAEGKYCIGYFDITGKEVVEEYSPSVLQTLSPEEIIPLGIDEEGNVFRKDLSLGKYGLQGWTIEEILHDIMDMPETTSKIFEKVKSDFDVAMDAEDKINIKKNYDILQEMLHWDNPLKKLLEIQMIGMEESNE